MATHQITREYWFSAAHRLEGHPKCGRLHGHNYKVIVGIESTSSLKQGWVLDYGVVDSIVKPILEPFDHRYIVSNENIIRDCPYRFAAEQRNEAIHLPLLRSTAEMLAFHFFQLLEKPIEAAAAGFDGHLAFVEVDETPKSEAVYYGD